MRSAEIERLFLGFDGKDVDQNDALLHVLQTLPFVELPSDSLEWLHGRLSELLERDHKFVRAWTFNAFGLLATADSRYRDEVVAMFEEAARSEPASVRARVRHAAKALGRG